MYIHTHSTTNRSNISAYRSTQVEVKEQSILVNWDIDCTNLHCVLSLDAFSPGGREISPFLDPG